MKKLKNNYFWKDAEHLFASRYLPSSQRLAIRSYYSKKAEREKRTQRTKGKYTEITLHLIKLRAREETSISSLAATPSGWREREEMRSERKEEKRRAWRQNGETTRSSLVWRATIRRNLLIGDPDLCTGHRGLTLVAHPAARGVSRRGWPPTSTTHGPSSSITSGRGTARLRPLRGSLPIGFAPHSCNQPDDDPLAPRALNVPKASGLLCLCLSRLNAKYYSRDSRDASRTHLRDVLLRTVSIDIYKLYFSNWQKDRILHEIS